MVTVLNLDELLSKYNNDNMPGYQAIGLVVPIRIWTTLEQKEFWDR